jgi:methionine-rich copper-binding protein CopC
MNTHLFRNSAKVSRYGAAAAVLLLSHLATAQTVVVSTTPARNAVNVSRTGAVGISFSQAVSAASAANVRVFGNLGQGLMPTTLSGGGTSSVLLQPQQAFRPGEKVSVTVPSTVRTAAGDTTVAQVFQFTAAAGPATGTFTGTTNFSLGNNARPETLQLADFNQDGNLDLATLDPIGGSLIVHLGNGQGGFGAATVVPAPIVPKKLVAADVNNDGKMDLVVAGEGGSARPVWVRLGDGAGGFTAPSPATYSSTPGVSNNLVVADVNGDGKLDYLSSNYRPNYPTPGSTTPTVSVRLGDGAGHFSGTTEIATGSSSLSHVLAVGDVNQDGKLDFVLADGSANTVRAFLGNGTGNFAPTGSPVAIAAGAGSVVLADLNGDGNLDAATANGSSNSVSVTLGNGSGGFGAATTLNFSTGRQPSNITAGDIDGDGDLDLAVSNIGATGSFPFPADVANVLVNNGAGSFTVTSSVAVDMLPYDVALGDINNDGALDLLTSNVYNRTISIRLNQSLAPPNLTVSSLQTVQGTYNNVTITGSGVARLSGPLTVNGTLTVQSGGILATNCQPVTGPGSFVLQAGGHLRICDAQGISGSGATGAVQLTGTRTYSPDAIYAYNGSTAQVTGAGLPSQVRALRVSNPGGVTLSAPLQLTQGLWLNGGNLNTNGQALTLLSSATGTAMVVNNGGVVNGTATVQRYIDPSLNAGPGYRHYAAPVSNTTVADLATAGFAPVVNPAYNTSATPNTVTPFPTVFGYNEARVLSSPATTYSAFDKGWESPASLAAPLEPGRGYTVNIPASQLVDFSGTLNNGTVSRLLVRTTNGDAGLHLLGNPYPAPINWSLVSIPTGVNNAMYVYQSTSQYGGAYRSYVNGVGNPRIAAGQGFFVGMSPNGATAQLNFTNAMRDTAFVAGPSFNRGVETRPLVQLMLRAAGSPLADEAYVYFETGATAGLDARYDAEKLPNTAAGVPSVALLAAGTELSINGLPQLNGSTVVPLGVSLPAAGSFSFEAAQLLNLTTAGVYLHDAVTGQDIDLRQQPRYAFTASAAGVLANRFALRFEPQRPTASHAGLTAASVSVHPNPAHQAFAVLVPAVAGAPQVQATLLNSLGQVVARQTVALPAAGARLTFDAASLAAGVYTVRLQAGSAVVAKRVVID